MKKVGIMGGTFDPPHYGHLFIANEVYHTLKLDEIWFMPNQIPPHKANKVHTLSHIRKQMVQLAIEECSYFYLQEIELEREGPSYTIETMKKLKGLFPDYDFYFIIGGDMVQYLPKWNKIDELIQLVTFVGVSRPGYEIHHLTEYPFLKLETLHLDISSSDIRKRVKNNQPIQFLLPDNLREFIEENKLYGTNGSSSHH